MKKIITFFTLICCLNTSAQCGLQNPSLTYTLGANGSITFSISATSTNPNDTVLYYGLYSNTDLLFIDTAYSSSFSSSFTYNYPANGTYIDTLFVVNNDYSCNVYIVDSIIITNSTYTCSNPQASFTYALGNNGQVIFTNTSTNLPLNSAYNWDFHGGPSSNTQNSPTITFPYNGTYNVSLHVYDSLMPNTCTASTNSIITISNTNPNPCPPAQLNFSMNSLGSGNWQAVISSYINLEWTRWSWGDSTYDEGFFPFTPSHTYSASGAYYICVQVKSNESCNDHNYVCGNDSLYRITGMINVQVVDASAASGVFQIQNQNSEIKIYPNPANSTIQITGIKPQDEIKMYDILGNQVLKSKERAIDISSLSNGVYFIRIGNRTQKIIKQ